MGTRSQIGMKMDDGTVRAIYCHWDGYPEYNGAVLRQHYGDRAKVEELLALGPISYLEARVKPNADEPHMYDKPAQGVTVAYHRDRGEKYTPPATYESEAEYLAEFKRDIWIEYAYLYRDGQWFVAINDKFLPLSNVLLP